MTAGMLTWAWSNRKPHVLLRKQKCHVLENGLAVINTFSVCSDPMILQENIYELSLEE